MVEKWRINILCLVGASLGIISFFVPWCTSIGQVIGSQPIQHNLIDILTDYILMGDWISQICIRIFLIGTLIAICSSLGGMIQLPSIAIFMLFQSLILMEGVEKLIIGFGLAMLSAIICFASLILPIGLGYDSRPFSLKIRLLNFSRIR